MNNKRYTLGAIAESVGGTVEGDAEIEITGVAPIESATATEISFVANNRYKKFIATTEAGALVLDASTECTAKPVLRSVSPLLTFAHIVDLFHSRRPLAEPGIHASAIISDSAQIDPTARIGALCHVCDGAVIGAGCELVSAVYVGHETTLGENCLIYPGVKLMHNTRIGNNVIIHASTVIGSDGFGFAESETGMKKIQQIGWVEIEDDVEIGSNVSVDRGALAPTRIGQGTKIDNLVQIAHNVEVGKHCIIVSQVGISGSTKIGDGVMLGGQVGLVGHIKVGDKVKIGAQSGVSKSVPDGKRIFGTPALDALTAMKTAAALPKLPELLRRVSRLEKKVGD